MYVDNIARGAAREDTRTRSLKSSPSCMYARINRASAHAAASKAAACTGILSPIKKFNAPRPMARVLSAVGLALALLAAVALAKTKPSPTKAPTFRVRPSFVKVECEFRASRLGAELTRPWRSGKARWPIAARFGPRTRAKYVTYRARPSTLTRATTSTVRD